MQAAEQIPNIAISIERMGAEASSSIKKQPFSCGNKENVVEILETISEEKPNITIDSDQNMKLLGGGRPKIVKAPNLRVITTSSNIIITIATLIRSLNTLWSIYDTHQRCRLGSCKFCAIRSLSQT